LIVATHPTTSAAKPPIGIRRAEAVYELFLTTATQPASPVRMCSPCICIEAHLKQFLLMKIRDKILIAGVLTALVDRSAGKS
jgi:hypothetical protein